MEFMELIEARRSVRKYGVSEISEAEVEAIVGEALNAPSWKNTEVTRYYAAVSAEAKRRQWDEALPSFNVAGPRESKSPGIQAKTKAFLSEVLWEV